VHTDAVSAQLHRLNWLLRARVVEAKLRELKHAVKAGFDPNEPRVPAGSGRTSGRWTVGGGGGGSSQVAQNFPRGGRGSGQARLRSGRLVEATPAQQARQVAVEAEAARLRRQVQEIDPAWEPSKSLSTPDSIEGDIAAVEGEAGEAQARLRELADQEPESLIDAYRRQQGLDLLGDPIWSREQNTVATCKVGDVPLIGTNSGSITYTQQDQSTAERWRDALLQGYPTVMNTRRIGGFPNNAVFHAEATCLLRAARANGGTLAGQTIEVQVDRAMCASCRTVLPYIGLELGNPTVVFTDPSGRVRIMRDGLWIK
jgi:hypothetical protein